jgi:hypothetical protein
MSTFWASCVANERRSPSENKAMECSGDENIWRAEQSETTTAANKCFHSRLSLWRLGAGVEMHSRLNCVGHFPSDSVRAATSTIPIVAMPSAGDFSWGDNNLKKEINLVEREQKNLCCFALLWDECSILFGIFIQKYSHEARNKITPVHLDDLCDFFGFR